MYRCVFIYNNYMYRWHGSIDVSMYAIDDCICDILLTICALTVAYMYIGYCKIIVCVL